MLLCCKNLLVLLWGPFFCGAPILLNMLNMPKSASAHGRNSSFFASKCPAKSRPVTRGGSSGSYEPPHGITRSTDPLKELITRTESAFRKKVTKMLHGCCFVNVGKTLTHSQILDCELYQNAFGGRAPPGLTGGAIALPQTT